MRKVLSVFIAVCLVLSLFTGVLAPVPSAKALGKGHFAYSPVDTAAHQAATITVTANKTVTTVLPDPFEPDNDPAHAHDIATDGSLQHHNFADNADEDWVKFTAVPGTTYTIDTLNLESSCDTMLELYGSPDIIDYNDDDGGHASRIDFECPAGQGGTYYVRVKPYSTYGADTGYDLRVQPALQVALSNADNAGKDYGLSGVQNHVTVMVTRSGVPVADASANVDWGTWVLTTDASGQTAFTYQESAETYFYLQVTSGDSKVTKAYFWVIRPTSALMTVNPMDRNGYYLTRFKMDAWNLVGGSPWTKWDSETSNTVTLPTTVSSSNLAVVTAASDEHGGVGYVFSLHPTLTAGQKTVLTPNAATDCVALSLSATLDSEPFMYANVFLRNQAYASATDLRAAVMDYLGASIIYLTPGTYTAVATKCYADPHVWLTKKDIVASSSTSASIAVTTPQLGTLTCLPLDGSSNPASANYLDLRSEGVSTELRTTVSNIILVSPGTYEELYDSMDIYPSGTSEEWHYYFACSGTHVMTAGSAVTVTFGGPLTMTVDTLSPVIPGQNVTTKLTVADSEGHRLYYVYGYTNLASPTGLPNEPMKGTQPHALQGEHPSDTPTSAVNLYPPIEADDWSSVYPKPHLVITDPAATVKVDPGDVSLNDAYWTGYLWTVPADATTGTWHAAFTLNTGVYKGVISTDQPFTVNPPPSYTLTPSAGTGGTITPNTPQTVLQGGSQTFTIAPNLGYHILDVTVDSVSVGAVSSYPFTNVQSDHVIHASFAPDTYTLTVTPPVNGTVKKDPDQATYSYNTVVTLTANPNPGHHFVNWSGDLTGTANPGTVTMDGDKTVTAAFAINTYTLTYTPGPHGTISGTLSQIVHYGASGTPVTAIPDIGYHFVQWSDGFLNTHRTDIAVDANVTVTATFVIDTHSLTVGKVGSGTVTLDPAGGTYDYGTIVTLTANPAPGCIFTGWSGDLTGTTNPATITMDANKTVTATFTPSSGTSFSLSLLPSWNVIAVPFPTPVSLLPSCDLFLSWDGSLWQPVTTLLPGTGYLVRNTTGATTVPLSGIPSSFPQTQPAIGTWQIIGNPYTTPASFACTSTVPYLLFWDGSLWQLASPTNLPPGLGFLLHASSPGTITLTLGAAVLPDLTVDTLYLDPAQPTVGGSVTFNFTIRNQGVASVAADYLVYIYVDGVLVGTGATDTDRLAGGASQGWYWDTTWPSDTASHTFMVVLDPAHVITESNESNNSASLSASAAVMSGTLTDLAKVLTLNYFNPVPVLPTAGTPVALASQYIYKMGDVIHGTVTFGSVAAGQLYTVQLKNMNGTVVDTVNAYQVAGLYTYPFQIGTANVSFDGPYDVVVSDANESISLPVGGHVYIQYNLTWMTNTIGTSGISTIEGWVTRGNGQTVLVPVTVGITYPDNTLAATYVVSPVSSGQFSLTFPVNPATQIGDYRLFMRDGYASATIPDNDAMIYAKLTTSVLPSVLDHFDIATIASQTAGVPFGITVMAKDQYNATYTSFTSTVSLAANKGTAAPATTSAFVAGVLTSFSVTIPGVNTGVILTVAASGKTGTSNAFDVTAALLYTLTTTTSPTAGGSIGRSPNAASYAAGTVVTLTANANPGYHFVNWSGDLTGTTNPTTITMSTNRSVTAVFAAETLAPAPPDLLSPTDKTVLSTLTPTLSWTTVPGATQYRITIWPTSYSSLYLVNELLATTSYVVPTGILSSFDVYGWTVRAGNSLGWSVNATFPGVTSLPTFTVQASTQLVAQTQLNGTFGGSKHDTIFKLANGQFWQQTSYDYKLATYAFWPDVTISYDSGLYKMTIEGVDGYILVTRLQQVIESELVDSSFTGSTYGTIFNLTNGQVWQQTSYDYVLGTYAYRPDVTIFYLNGGFKLKIEGVDTPVGVARLP